MFHEYRDVITELKQKDGHFHKLFEKHNELDKLNAFVSTNAKKIYDLNLTNKTIKLIKKDFVVPAIYEYKNENVVPMYAGETISWSIESIN